MSDDTELTDDTCISCGGRMRWHTPPSNPFPPGVVGLILRIPEPHWVCDHCRLDFIYLHGTACWPEIETLRGQGGHTWTTHSRFIELESEILQRYTVLGEPPQAVLDEVAAYSSRNASSETSVDDEEDEDEAYWRDLEEANPTLSNNEVHSTGPGFMWNLGRAGIRENEAHHMRVPYEYIVQRWTPGSPDVTFSVSVSDYVRIAGADRIGPNAAMWHRLNSLRTHFWF